MSCGSLTRKVFYSFKARLKHSANGCDMTINDLQSFKREVILALFADNALVQQLVLKGGNLLDVVYGISTRPSRDIDLSICGEVEDLDHFRETFRHSVACIRRSE